MDVVVVRKAVKSMMGSSIAVAFVAQGQEKKSDIASSDPLARGARTLRLC